MLAKRIKSQLVSSKYQSVVLDRNGIIIDTCNSLFDWRNLTGSLFEISYFLKSIEHLLLTLEDQEELFLAKIVLDSPVFRGTFNFTFKAFVFKGDMLIGMVFNDTSTDYEFEKQLMQERNDAIIRFDEMKNEIQKIFRNK